MRDFFAFRRMIAGVVIQVVFVLGLIAIVIAFIASLANDQALVGLLVLVFGTLYWRIICEVFIVLFRMNESLDTIKANTAALASTPPGPGGTPARVEAAPGASPAAGASAAPTATSSPEGWYDDSERPGHKRWWDGTKWGRRDDE
jgi:hypothetical protein